MEVAVVVGSESDLPVIQETVDILRSFDIETVADIVSAHRTPEKLVDFGTSTHHRGFNVIVTGAGGVAHLPGMLATMSPLPIISIPVKSSNSISGWDSVLSVLQMPSGVPIATVAFNGAENTGILAAQVLASQQPAILNKTINYKESLKQAVLATTATLNDE